MIFAQIEVRFVQFRSCPFCDEVENENESHVVLSCYLCDDIRIALFNTALTFNPHFMDLTTEDKLIFLFSNIFMIRITAKTCFNILQRRAFYLSK